jgi:hypothetical protein
MANQSAQKHWTHHEWLMELKLSVVGNNLIPRVGRIMNMNSCDFNFMLPLLWKMKMTLFLHWGNIDDCPLRVQQFLVTHHLVPSHTDIKHLCTQFLAIQPPGSNENNEVTLDSNENNEVTLDSPPWPFPPVE